MSRKISPFLGVSYGWEYGENNWNTGMDENLKKFSFLLDGNIDGIVSNLPVAVEGTAYYSTIDSKIHYVVDGIYQEIDVPVWAEYTLKTTGDVYRLDGAGNFQEVLPSISQNDADARYQQLSEIGVVGASLIAATTAQEGRTAIDVQTTQYLVARANHTGTQAISTVVGLQTSLDTLQQNITTSAATKVDKVSGKQLSTEDYTTADKQKVAGIGSGLTRIARTSNVVLSKSEQSYLIDYTSGTFAQTFTAASILGNGWYCYLQNRGSGDITLTPTSPDSIDGLSSFIMYPGEVRIVQCDGTSLWTVILNPFSKIFTTSGNFVKPPGYRQFSGILWSGGGSGRKGGSDAYGGTGAAGTPFTFLESAFSSTTPVVIGSGGPGATATGNGSAGGLSTFKGIYCGPGKAGGTSPAAGGDAYKVSPDNTTLSGGLMNISDSVYGGAGTRSNAGTQYADTVYGGAAGGSILANLVNTTASMTLFGGSGGAASLTSPGSDGIAPGGGGGSTQTGTTSGAGARGELRIVGVI